MLGDFGGIPAVLLAIKLPFDPIEIVLFGAALVYFFWLLSRVTSGLVKTANGFFEAMARQDLGQARRYFLQDMSPSDERSLREFLSRSAFSEFQKVRWHSRSVTNDQGALEGSIIMKNGAKVPIKVNLVREEDAWKICSFEKPESDFRFGVGVEF